MTVPLLGLVLAATASIADVPSVWLAPSPFTELLRPMLEEELASLRITDVPDGAAIALSLDRDGSGALRLAIAAEGTGEVILERTISLDHGEPPALRAALVVATAFLSSEPPTRPLEGATLTEKRETLAKSSTTAGYRIEFSIAGEITSFGTSPIAPELGGRLGLDLAFSKGSIGLRAALAGSSLCCALTVQDTTGNNALTASPRLYTFSGRFGYRALDLGRFEAGPSGELGISISRITARSLAWMNAPNEDTNLSLGVVGRVGGYLSIEVFERVRLVIDAGVSARTNRLETKLPTTIPGLAPSGAIDSGIFAAALGIGVAWRAF